MSKKTVIPGGFYIKARKIQQSAIQHAPPHIREAWDWLLMRANHADSKCGGRIIKRGQVFCSWRDIQEGLSWQIGYRKMRYSQSKCENATKWLTKAGMITATKTTRGRIITIVNYDLYQNPANYEYRNERRKERRSAAEVLPNDKQEEEEIKNKYSPNSIEFHLSSLLLSEIQKRKPDYKKPNLQIWSKHIDRMIRIDKRNPDKIVEVIKWCQQDAPKGDSGFGWQDNILSTAKLREKFDKLELAMEKTGEQEYAKPLQYDSGGLTPRERLRMKLEKEKQQEIEGTKGTQEYADAVN